MKGWFERRLDATFEVNSIKALRSANRLRKVIFLIVRHGIQSFPMLLFFFLYHGLKGE